MSTHRTPLTPIEEAGLHAHGLQRDIGKPSQLVDVFRQGVAWGIKSQSARIRELEADINRRDSANTAMLNKMFELQAERDALQGQVAGLLANLNHLTPVIASGNAATIAATHDARVRNLAIEECANVCERVASRCQDRNTPEYAQAHDHSWCEGDICADQIRALKTGEAK